MHYSFWLSAFQVLTPELPQPDSPSSLLAAALTLAGLAVMVYRLGVWREEVANTTRALGAELARGRDDNTLNFANINRRLDTIDQANAATTEHRVAVERWQARADATLGEHGRAIEAVGTRVDRLEAVHHGEVP